MATAEQAKPNKDTKVNLDSKVKFVADSSIKLGSKIDSLEIDLNSIEEKQNRIKLSVERSADIQTKIHNDTLSLLELLTEKNDTVKSISVKLIQATNWYVFILPLVTIFIIIFSTKLSIKTISIKSQESLSALKNSNEKQYQMNKENRDFDRDRSQEVIISASRQEWINTLRKDISSVLANLTKYKMAEGNNKKEIFNEIWLEHYKIQLLLNPNEDDHEALLLAINIVIGSCDDDNGDFLKKQAVVVEKAQSILKREWIRVKAFV
jgi:hypothetical protein